MHRLLPQAYPIDWGRSPAFPVSLLPPGRDGECFGPPGTMKRVLGARDGARCPPESNGLEGSHQHLPPLTSTLRCWLPIPSRNMLCPQTWGPHCP